jgi:MFS superfamily sulfate permease-like transporter
MSVMVVLTVVMLVVMGVVVASCVALVDHQRHALVAASMRLARVVEQHGPDPHTSRYHTGAITR